MQPGGIILCGGLSSRMGLAKAWLPFGKELMLQRVHRLLSEVVGPVVVVAAADQALPELPEGTLFARDERPGRGPLEGLLAGMKMLQSRSELVYVTSCDVPLLQTEFVRRLLALAADYDAIAPQEGDFCHPLSSVYRTRVLPAVESHLARDQLSPSVLLRQINTRFVPVADLSAIDPQLLSLRNVNRPADYYAALEAASLPLDKATRTALDGAHPAND
jgi:molybdopterin-guanine dinucleotide biosynthesis protein A